MSALEGLAKAAIFSAVSAFLVFGLTALYWPTMYFTVPLLVPFAPYFNETHWAYEVAYFVAIGGLSAVLARSRSWPRSIAIFLGVCLCGALITHVTLNILGYNYFMETP